MMNIQRVVVKVGTSVLAEADGSVGTERIQALADQVARAAQPGRQIAVVSSGAIACGMTLLGLRARPRSLAQLQACAAVGQGELMRRYARAFGRHELRTAQVLLTQDDLSDRVRHRNARSTLLTLLRSRVVPIVNENDTVAVEEITFGDNDRLAALVAAAVEAQLLVLLTDVEGLLQDGRLIDRVERVDASHHQATWTTRRHTTKGGMASKLDAARIVGHHGISVVIANGRRPEVLTDLLAGQPVGTLFVPPAARLTPRKWRIAFTLRRPKGQVMVDAGAAHALAEGGKSLLASGVQAVQGRFEEGACVAIVDARGSEIARGVVNYSASELSRVRGMKSAQLATTLGQSRAREVVHRDQLVLAKELHG